MNFRVLIPEGRALPEAVWRARHRGIVILLWAHVVGLAVFAVLTGAEPLHALTESGVVAMMALLAGLDRWGRRFAETMACLGLLTSSALLVHFSGGYIEMHFHFFVMVGLMALYMSGYTDDTIGRHGVLDDQTKLLTKPFLPADLLRKVREVLDR